MGRLISYNLSDNYIYRLADFIEKDYLKKCGEDISNLAFVFGGRRPALFLKKELSSRIKNAFFSPKFFSIDEFVEYSLSKNKSFSKISDLDACFLIYNLTKDMAPGILKNRETFSQFMPWAREILSFIEQLDLEDILDVELKEIELKAAIGYDVPLSINTLLTSITSLRDAYHAALKVKNAYTRGMIYMLTAEHIQYVDFPEFSDILFCGFFYLHKTEIGIIKNLYDKQKATLVFQGKDRDWSVLNKVFQDFSSQVETKQETESKFSFSISAGFDVHSQVCLASDALRRIKNLDETVIVLPEPDNLIPLLSEISSIASGFNISMGYPLRRSSVYSLFECIFKTQETRNSDKYYAKDYLRLLSHPLLKNLKLASENPGVTRIFVHKVEEVIAGIEKTPLGGSLFFDLSDLEKLEDLYSYALELIRIMDIKVTRNDLDCMLKQLHDIFFRNWENIGNFSDFSLSLEGAIGILTDRSFLDSYPLNLKIIDKILSIKEEFDRAAFIKEPFPKEDIFKIFKNKLDNEEISFSGSPLKGLQVLGLLETRSLSFKNVIIMDVNEQVLPNLKISEPLIPREVMINLGLNRLEKEEEIQRYQFRRLITSATEVHLIYEESPQKERSRFIEELVWEIQKRDNKLDVVSIPRAVFGIQVLPRRIKIVKKREELEYLRKIEYSPSSIDTYISCPLKFYYQYVLRLQEKEDILDEPETADVGVFIHKLLEETFAMFVGKRPLIDKRFRDYFFAALDKKFEVEFKRKMKSDSFMVKEILDFRMNKFLDNEVKRKVIEIVALEKTFNGRIKLSGEYFNFIARIDRLDRLEDTSILVLDYKTGGGDIPKEINIDNLEKAELDREFTKKIIKSFQLPIYLYFIDQEYNNLRTNAALYSIRDPEKDSGLKLLLEKEWQFANKDKIMRFFLRALESVVRDILNPEIPFIADNEGYRKCEYCHFSSLCG